jgi:hypothetical protein
VHTIRGDGSARDGLPSVIVRDVGKHQLYVRHQQVLQSIVHILGDWIASQPGKLEGVVGCPSDSKEKRNG